VNVLHVNPDAKVIAFHRWADGGPGDDVVLVANFSTCTAPFLLAPKSANALAAAKSSARSPETDLTQFEPMDESFVD
jgi:hypothetical protein